MRGLILKDFLNLKKYGKQIVLILGVFLLFGIMMKSALYVCFMMLLYGTMTIISAMSYDERAGFDKYALSLPIERKDIVKSKYIVWLIIMCVANFISMVVGILISLFFEESIMELIVSVLVVSAVYMILYALTIPFMFKLGVEKGRMIMMAIFILPSVIGVLIGTMYKKIGIYINIEKIAIYVEQHLFFFVIGLIILVVTIIYGSYIVSVKVVAKKEY